MCGITGIYAFNEVGRYNMINLSAATDCLNLRGPDSRGIFNEERVGLGHRRLSIIDTTSDGRQPMTDDSGRYVIVFNGEIFNFKELRQKLENTGTSFFSHSDTEVLLKLYIKEGADCLNQLNGFFAFAIYDKEEKILFVARDRYGIKPLFVFQDEDKLIFASELKSLMAFGINKDIDYTSLYQYLQLNYIPGPATIFKNVTKLSPGHYLQIKGREILQKRYYDIPPLIKTDRLSYQQQQDKLVELMDDAVKKRMIADVPLGAFLSGGIDSSIIVGLASRYTEKLNTFSIGYRDEPFFDETKYANLVAKKFNTNHTVFSLTNQDLLDNLQNVLEYIDEPFGDSSALPVFILSKETRKHVTVSLSGDGADELFGGYNKYLGEYKVREGGIAANTIRGLLPLWKNLPKSRNGFVSNKVRQFQRFAEGMEMSPKERYWKWCGFAREDEALSVLKLDSRIKIFRDIYEHRKENITKYISNDGDLNDVLRADVNLVLTNDMLTKVDLMSMANSLEVRVPFLDYRVVDFAFSLKANTKVDGRMKKKIVQDAFRSLLPAELYNRPKHGFEVPLLKWFRKELRSLIENNLLEDKFILEQGIFDPEEIQKLKKQLFSNNPGDIHARIWGLIVFQSWWKKWMR
ncbi:MAG TPA: asparagine synthase (glutamine-hydrolyzing) [Cytophagales bacterium]|nr:asparagine synthase (glutamine-hydrolyzing) [Cytophagales bacterium]